jgi:predicted HTH transcriptional regulator
VWIFSKPLDQLAGEDFVFLIANRVRESATLEFKRDVYGANNAGIREMARDVSALANAEGGILIIGMAEDDDGVAKELCGVPEAEIQANRLIASCMANVSERIPGLRALPIPLVSGHVIVAQIPRSYRRPHMITFEGANDFWIRHDRQKSRMSIAEVRTAVTMTEELERKVERFLEDRRRGWAEEEKTIFVLSATPLLLEEGRIAVTDVRLARATANTTTWPRRDSRRRNDS